MNSRSQPSPQTSDRGLSVLPDECISINETHAAHHAYIACAFYTLNYLPHIKTLKQSLDAQGISYFFKRYENRPTWEESTRLKPAFLGYCLEKFPHHDILYLDADAVVRKPLDFFDTVTADVSLLLTPKRKRDRNYLRLSSGTILIRNTPGGRRFVEIWKSAEPNCSPLNHDEDMIHQVFPKFAGVSIALLPAAYSKIFDEPCEDAAIEHFQASRSQFKPSYTLRKVRRVAIVVAAVAALAGLIWLLTSMWS